jgi:two-component system, chemotaxis family, sensor kinase CheA
MAQDPYKYFRVEASELVGYLAKGVLDLENRADAALVARLLRQAHTLKGAARIVKHRELADLAHALEDVLAPLRDHPVTQRHDQALALVDRMTAQLATLAPSPSTSPAPAPTTAAATPNDSAVMSPTTVVAPIARMDTEAVDEALSGLAVIHALVGRVQATTDPEVSARLVEVIDRELHEVRRDVERVRLSAASVVFPSLERTARDAALASGKRVTFAAVGANVRVDAQVLGSLHGALVQLVRNAVVHGIEAPNRRTAAGKPADGRVTITIKSLGRRIAVICEDDGAGLDVEAIRRAAEQRGVTGDRQLQPGELFALLLRGGISTSRQVTELSGRGIGLDVVRDAVQGLGGEVSATTSAGGTTITLVVPVSLTAMSVLNVEAGGRMVAIPQAAVRRVARVRDRELVRVGPTTSIAFDDLTVPCMALSTVLGNPGPHGPLVVLVDGGDELGAVTVDRVLGIDDTVVRASPEAPIDAIVSGIALDAAGDPYMVLDPRAVVAATRVAQDIPAQPASRKLRVLVIDDSLTTRMLEQTILESAGFDVAVAASAEEGLDRLARDSVDVVLVDVEMPGMDGFAMITELRARPALARIPAILVTSRDAPEDRRRGTAVGAQGYVIKGEFDQTALLAMIRRLV